MNQLAPVGPVYQAGTLSGNPVAVAAGLTTLEHCDDALYSHLNATATQVGTLASEALTAEGVPHQLQVGGNLSEILAKISETVRERAKIRGEISTLTAEGRVSAWVVFAIPIALFFWLAASNPEYMKPLLQETTGHYLLGVALCMQMLGMGIIFRMLNMEI